MSNTRDGLRSHVHHKEHSTSHQNTRTPTTPRPRVSPDQRMRAKKNTLRWNSLPCYRAKILTCEEDCITESICIQPNTFNSIRTEVSLTFSHSGQDTKRSLTKKCGISISFRIMTMYPSRNFSRQTSSLSTRRYTDAKLSNQRAGKAFSPFQPQPSGPPALHSFAWTTAKRLAKTYPISSNQMRQYKRKAATHRETTNQHPRSVKLLPRHEGTECVGEEGMR